MKNESLNKSPAVSIIVLNWNGERYLGRCLDAIAAQTFRDYEVLVLDNASTDGSVDGFACSLACFSAGEIRPKPGICYWK